MERLGILLQIWLMQAIIGGGSSAVILAIWHNRAGFSWWQSLTLFVPYTIWAVLMLSPLALGRKSLANLGEPIFVSFTMPILAFVRVAVGKRISETRCAVGFISFLSLLTVAVFFLVPFLPE